MGEVCRGSQVGYRLDVLNAPGGFPEKCQMDGSGCLTLCAVPAQRGGRYVQQLGLLVNAAGHVVKDGCEVREVSGVWCTKHHMAFVRFSGYLNLWEQFEQDST